MQTGAIRGSICPIIAGVRDHSDLRASVLGTGVVGQMLGSLEGPRPTKSMTPLICRPLNESCCCYTYRHIWRLCAQPSDMSWEEGFLIWIGQRGNKFEAPGWWQAANPHPFSLLRPLPHLGRAREESRAISRHCPGCAVGGAERRGRPDEARGGGEGQISRGDYARSDGGPGGVGSPGSPLGGPGGIGGLGFGGGLFGGLSILFGVLFGVLSSRSARGRSLGPSRRPPGGVRCDPADGVDPLS